MFKKQISNVYKTWISWLHLRSTFSREVKEYNQWIISQILSLFSRIAPETIYFEGGYKKVKSYFSLLLSQFSWMFFSKQAS